MSDPREVTVLGSTGSIGRQAVQVAQQNPDRLRITALAAGGGDVARLADQALTLGVRTVAVGLDSPRSILLNIAFETVERADSSASDQPWAVRSVAMRCAR